MQKTKRDSKPMHNREKAALKQGQAKQAQSHPSLENIWSCAVKQGVLGQDMFKAVSATPRRSRESCWAGAALAGASSGLPPAAWGLVLLQEWRVGAVATGYARPRLCSSPEVPTVRSLLGWGCSQLSRPVLVQCMGGQGEKEMVEGERLGN